MDDLNKALSQQELDNQLDELAINQFASEDLKRAITLQELPDGSFAYKIDDAIYRSTNALIEAIGNSSRKSYLKSEQRKQQLEQISNDVNARYQEEKDELQQQVVDAANEGNIELFKKLRKKQGAKFRI